MSMSVGSPGGSDETLCDMNTTPLIDVMLVLLVMLIITIPIQLHAVKLDFPPPNNTPQPPHVEPPKMEVDITYGPAILLNGEPITMDLLEKRFAREGRVLGDKQATLTV